MAANYVANRFTNGRPEWGTTSGGHRWLLAGVFLAEGDGDAALELLAPLEEALPGQYEVLAGLGFARFLRGELEQAKGYLEKAMTIRQPKGRRIPRASKLLICGLFQEGRVLAQDGLEAACVRALALSSYSYHTVKNILSAGLDRVVLEEETESRPRPGQALLHRSG